MDMEFLRLLEGLRTPFGDLVMQVVTLFGEETLFMVIAMIVLWCVNKKQGFFLLYVGFFGAALNQMLKLICRIPRPWVRDPSFTIVESAREAATGYSFPSGHTQSAGGTFFGSARFTSCKWIRAASIAIVLLVAFSRMYLGVHTPADVGVSLLISGALVLVFWPLFNRSWENTNKALLLSAVLVTYSVCTVVYAELAAAANPGNETLLHGVKTTYQLLGTSIGFLFVKWIDDRYIRFDTKAPLPVQLVKVLGGLSLVILLRLVTKAPLLALTNGHDSANGIRYLLMTLFGGAVWPLSFPLWNHLFSKDRKKSEGAA